MRMSISADVRDEGFVRWWIYTAAWVQVRSRGINTNEEGGLRYISSKPLATIVCRAYSEASPTVLLTQAALRAFP
jgi:hypothetical protein